MTTYNVSNLDSNASVVTVTSQGPQGADAVLQAGNRGDFTVAIAGNGSQTATINTGAVTSDKILDGTILNVDINASAGILGTKISPNFGSQNITTTGNIAGAGGTFSNDLSLITNIPTINLTSTIFNSDYRIQNYSGTFTIKDVQNASNRLTIASDGTANFSGNLDVGAGLDITGDITVTGLVDSVDIAARDTLFGGLTSSSGVLTNGVTATTQSAGDNSAKVATTAYTDTAISNLVDSSPAALNTLNELAAALGDDANFSTTVTNSIATKLSLSGGTIDGNVTLNDGKELFFGTDNDFKIKHSGSLADIVNSTGNLRLETGTGNNILFRTDNDDGTHTNIIICDGTTGSEHVDLYHSGSRRLATESDGVRVIGLLKTGFEGELPTLSSQTRAVFSGSFTTGETQNSTSAISILCKGGANSRINLGTDTNENQSQIKYRKANNDIQFLVTDPTDNELNTLLEINSNTVKLNFAGAKKAETSATGFDITGHLTASGTIDGTLKDGVTATTQSISDNSTKVATTAFAQTLITNTGVNTKLPLAGGTLTGNINISTSTPRIFFLDNQTADNNLPNYVASLNNGIFKISETNLNDDTTVAVDRIKIQRTDTSPAGSAASYTREILIFDDVTIKRNGPSIILNDTGNNSDYRIRGNDGAFIIQDFDVSDSNVAAWNVNASYEQGQKVKSNSKIYQAQSNVTGGTQPSHNTGVVNNWLFLSHVTADARFKIFPNGDVKISENLLLPDSSNILLGSDEDLSISHTGSDAKITNTTGNLKIESKTNQLGIQVIPDNAIELHYSGTKKAETSSTGFDVSGFLNTTHSTNGYSLFKTEDAGSGLKIASKTASSATNLVFSNNHSGTLANNWFIQAGVVSSNYSFTVGKGDIDDTSGTATPMLQISDRVELNYANTVNGTFSTKAQTSSTGFEVLDDLKVTGDIFSEDKFITLANIATPTDTQANNSGLYIKGSTNKHFRYQIGNNSFNSTENITITADKKLRFQSKFEIFNSSGIGDNALDFDSTANYSQNDYVKSGGKIYQAQAAISAGGSAPTHNNATVSNWLFVRVDDGEEGQYIKDASTGPLKLLTSTLQIKNANDNKLSASFIPNGAVNLLYNNEPKLSTTDTGINVKGGILFNDDTADANTLDDYEEGTFTPLLQGSSGNPTSVTYTVQSGHYTKIGNLVHIQVSLSVSAYTGGGGEFQLGGLPFTALAAAPTATVNYNQNNKINWGSQVLDLSFYIAPNSTQVRGRKFKANGNSGLNLVAFATDGFSFGITGTYLV